MLYPHPVVLLIRSALTLRSCASIPRRYKFTLLTINFTLNTMGNRVLHCMQSFILYICLSTTLWLDELPSAAVYCHTVSLVLRIDEECSEVFDPSIRMLSITAVFGPMNLGFAYECELRGVARSPQDRRALQAAVLFTRGIMRASRLDCLISKQRMRH